jgi:hypothetical protein
MTTAAPVSGYTINEDEPRRIKALDANGTEICGAYQPAGHEYWSLYCTKTVTQITGLKVPPHREHFYGCNGRKVAKEWVTLIACLAALAVKGAA